MAEIKLGSKVQDKLTGFVGFATARCEYINGCIQYEVTPEELKDGVMQKGLWVDEERLAEEKAIEKEPLSEPTKPLTRKRRPPRHHLAPSHGGPQNTPTRGHPPELGGYDEEET